MDRNEYLKQRVDDQIQWYDNKSIHNKKFYNTMKMTEITLSVSIPFLVSTISGAGDWMKWVVGTFGLIIALFSGIRTLNKYHEKWIEYRTTSETLKHHRFLFLTNSGPYAGPDADTAFKLFVQQIEQMISQQNSEWSKYMTPGQVTGNEAKA